MKLSLINGLNLMLDIVSLDKYTYGNRGVKSCSKNHLAILSTINHLGTFVVIRAIQPPSNFILAETDLINVHSVLEIIIKKQGHVMYRSKHPVKIDCLNISDLPTSNLVRRVSGIWYRGNYFALYITQEERDFKTIIHDGCIYNIQKLTDNK